MLSLVIPVYKNELGIDRLLSELVKLNERLDDGLEVVLVVDGSPDRSHALLRERLPATGLRAKLLLLSRNFGSFCAIAAGLAAGSGDYFAVIAADLQEPPQLVEQFLDALASRRADIVFGVREGRSDPWLSEMAASAFWGIYRRLVVRDVPQGGVDVFGCTREVRTRLLALKEANTNLIALLFWIGYRREFIGYRRQPRLEGQSAWTLSKKLQYCVDSIFNFTDLPIQLLLYAGVVGMGCSALVSVILLIARLTGNIPVPGYTPIVLSIMFFGGLTSLGLGIVGQYLWLALQNTRNRPNYIVANEERFGEGP